MAMAQLICSFKLPRFT